MSKRERGQVRWFTSGEGYGRITSDEFHDVLFVHFSSIVSAGYKELQEGQTVEYTRVVQPGPHGERPVAIDVIALS